MKQIFTILTTLIIANCGMAQELADTLLARLNEQYYEYPQEKIHVMTDRNHYM